MNDKELIRRALLGDQEAQKECTEKGIVLSCPFCGASGDDVNLDYNSDISQFWIHCWKCHADGPLANYNANDAFALWNTRPAPPVGRCGECKHAYINFFSASSGTALCRLWTNKTEGIQMVMQQNDFCSYFEPREE